MKPMNDDARKGAITKAGFFTLIPMLLVGCLVWGGMKGEGNNKTSKSFNKVIKDSRDSISSVYGLLETSKFHRDTVQKIMLKRKDLETKYYEAFSNDMNTDKPSNDDLAKCLTELETLEQSAKNFLDTEISKIKNDDIYQTVAYQFKTFHSDLNLCIENRKKYLTSFDSKDEQVAALEEKIKNLNVDLKDATRPCLDHVNDIADLENKVSKLERDSENNNRNNNEKKKADDDELKERLKNLATDIRTHIKKIDKEFPVVTKDKRKKKKEIEKALEEVAQNVERNKF